MSPPTVPPRHYPTASAKCADLVVHVVGLTLALVGGIVLLALAVRAQSLSMAFAVGIYALGLLAMLGFSTAYNFAKPRFRPTLRRLDHAGIFLMIAGSYTPFTTQTLTGAWAWGMTGEQPKRRGPEPPVKCMVRTSGPGCFPGACPALDLRRRRRAFGRAVSPAAHVHPARSQGRSPCAERERARGGTRPQSPDRHGA